MARRSGVAVSALHFYEAKGLITSNRNAGNQRRYGREVLRRVAIIKVAQRAGIPLASIREALDENIPADAEGQVTITVPPLSAAVWRAVSPLARSRTAPQPVFTAAPGSGLYGR